MKSSFWIGLFLLICTSTCLGQDKEQIQFIESYFSKSNFSRPDKLVYGKGLWKFEIEDILKSLAKDTIFSLGYKYESVDNLLILSKEDKKQIDSQLDSLSSDNWYESLHLENAQAVSQDSIKAIFANTPDLGWQYFRTKYGKELYHFSKPVLLRNNTLCLFYYSNACGSLCGEGYLTLFRKEQGSWVKWFIIYSWVS